MNESRKLPINECNNGVIHIEWFHIRSGLILPIDDVPSSPSENVKWISFVFFFVFLRCHWSHRFYPIDRYIRHRNVSLARALWLNTHTHNRCLSVEMCVVFATEVSVATMATSPKQQQRDHLTQADNVCSTSCWSTTSDTMKRMEEKLKAISGGNTDERVVNWFLTLCFFFLFRQKKNVSFFRLILLLFSQERRENHTCSHCCAEHSIVSPVVFFLFVFYLNLMYLFRFQFFLLLFLPLNFWCASNWQRMQCALTSNPIDPHMRAHSLNLQFCFSPM